jgi:TolB-like protein
MHRRTPRRHAQSPTRCAPPASKCGLTRVNCAAAMSGIRRFAGRSATARSSCRLFPRIRRRGRKGTSGSSGASPSSARTSWGAAARSSCRCAWTIRPRPKRTFRTRSRLRNGRACTRETRRLPSLSASTPARSPAPASPAGANLHAATPAAVDAATRPAAATRGAKLAWLLLAGAVVVAEGYFALNRWVLSKRAVESQATLVQSVAPAQNAIPDKSIAVLPFVDMSEKKDQEYFSDGLAEELIDLLAQVPNLKVTARTSSFYFKGKSEDIATIAQKLRVANLLEGSVRKAGNTMRVTATADPCRQWLPSLVKNLR